MPCAIGIEFRRCWPSSCQKRPGFTGRIEEGRKLRNRILSPGHVKQTSPLQVAWWLAVASRRRKKRRVCIQTRLQRITGCSVRKRLEENMTRSACPLDVLGGESALEIFAALGSEAYGKRSVCDSALEEVLGIRPRFCRHHELE